VAPGYFHLNVVKAGSGWLVRCTSGALVSGHRPSVDVMFHSVALAAGAKALGVLLTGMGKDGADGLLAMRAAGARCFAQDEASSVVFGMPKAAWDNGAAERLIPLEQMAESLMAVLR
jgi:two-component system chemotaxis response regulator CheB